MNRAVRLVVFAFMILVAVGHLSAQQTGTGTLTISATVQSSISVILVSDASGVALSGSGTNAASMAFGNISAYGVSFNTGVTQTRNGMTNFSVSTPFVVRVEKSNSASATYTLMATLTTADAAHVWTIDIIDLSDGVVKQLTATGTYSADVSHTLKITTPVATLAGAVSNSIGFLATAN